ncbi:winged helix DNA-binding domain-containing protein [Aquipuribacter sp. MA13-6]|uniref:winged helix DNA-binding domain-containing protein n=1 Tax=unclassified Aquipuribacter TaxID=2635084 RepID=UPI003EEB574B
MVTTVTPREVGLLRLVAQGLVGVVPGTGALDVVRRLTAVQAQDLPGALTSVALRTSSRARDDVVAALDGGSVVRTWPMRGTLHLVAADDLGWLLRTTAVRSLSRFAARQAELGIDTATLGRATALADALLATAHHASPGRRPADTADTADRAGPGVTRAELMGAWEDAGITTSGQRGYHLVVHLALTGLLCLGPTSRSGPGSQPRCEQSFVRVADWVGPGLAVDGDEALAELARRYFLGHGPATAADLARWAGITAGQARTGLAAAAASLTPVEVDGVQHWLDPAVPDRLAGCRDEAEQVLLLPGFDEYLLGYADRSAVLAPEHAERVVPGRNGVFRPTVVDAGRVVGTWRRAGSGHRGPAAGVLVEPFTPLSAGVEAAATEAHARLP